MGIQSGQPLIETMSQQLKRSAAANDKVVLDACVVATPLLVRVLRSAEGERCAVKTRLFSLHFVREKL